MFAMQGIYKLWERPSNISRQQIVPQDIPPRKNNIDMREIVVEEERPDDKGEERRQQQQQRERSASDENSDELSAQRIGSTELTKYLRDEIK